MKGHILWRYADFTIMALSGSVLRDPRAAAYDTVWRQRLMYKLICIIPCKKVINLIDNMLSNPAFQVILGNESKLMKLNNGLSQGSVLAPLLSQVWLCRATGPWQHATWIERDKDNLTTWNS